MNIQFPTRTQGVPDHTLVNLGDVDMQYYWTGEKWISVKLSAGEATVKVQDNPPSNPYTENFWYNNTLGILSHYYNSQWINVEKFYFTGNVPE